MKVSICIPTFNRAPLLMEALHSCLNQSLKPCEILIGDDSDNDETAQKIAEIGPHSGIDIRYYHHNPSLKQVRNIDNLFKSVRGDKVILLHDDDLLLPHAVESLARCFRENPGVKVAFGKQYIIDESGRIDQAASENLNEVYFRTPQYAGEVLTPLEAGFLQQFPNDGYMFDVSVLDKVGYGNGNCFIGEVGDACDYHFGIQLGMHDYKMFFTNEYLCKYRLSSHNSISSSATDDAGFRSFQILRHTNVPPSSKTLKDKALKNKVSVAVSQAARKGNRKEAADMFFSPWHRSQIFTPGGLKRFLMILSPHYFSRF